MTENQEPENHDNKGTGNDNKRIQGGYIQGNFSGNYNNSGDYIEGNSVRGRNNFLNNNFALFGRQGTNEALTSEKHSRIRQDLLKQVSLEVESRIESSLHNRVYIVLDAEQNPEQIELPWESEIKVGSEPKVHLTNTEITTVFDEPDIGGRLLILGKPGVGKTTMLLKLAEELVKRAKNDSAYPIAVLFSLASWKNDIQNIKDWLVDQLKNKYGVRKDIGKQLVKNQEIIPLLDGLDELAAERQEKCVIKINEFLHPSNWTNPVVVCSRIQEYQRNKALLQLNNSLELRPFTQEQVYQYLQKTGHLQLCNSINQDEELSNLATTPLLLNIIVLSAEELSIERWQQFKSSQKRLSYLFEAYVTRMLERPYKDKKQPKQEKTKRWLGWLAQRLIEESATEFLIEKMQPSWLKKKIPKVVYNLILWGFTESLTLGLMFGLLHGLMSDRISGLSYELTKGLILGLILGLVLGLISGLTKGSIFRVISRLTFSEQLIGGDDIQTIEKINFSLKKFSKKSLIYGLISGLGQGLSHKLIFVGLIGGLIYGLIYAQIDVIEGREIENKTIPNQGIRQSVINTIIISAGFCLLTTFLIFVLKKVIQPDINLGQALIFSLVYGVFVGLLIAIPKSGIPAIKHFVLRVILWSNGYAPWNYAKFLDYCTNRLFLQRVGGSYRFMHDLLRQHFANSYGQKNLAPVQATPVEPSPPQV